MSIRSQRYLSITKISDDGLVELELKTPRALLMSIQNEELNLSREQIKLQIFREINLLDHSMDTLIEYHNLVKQYKDSESRLELKRIQSVVNGIINNFIDTKQFKTLEQIEEIIAISFINDPALYRRFLEGFLRDFQNTVLFESKKVAFLAFIILGALKNPDPLAFFSIDDLIICLEALKQKMQNLTINEDSLNF